MNLCRILPLSGVLFAGVIHAASIDLSGTVYDRAFHPLAGVVVSIPDSGWSTTTDSKGQWRIDGAAAGVSKASTLQLVRWNGRGLDLELSRAATVSVDVFDLQGARLEPSTSMYLGKGGHEVPLNLGGAPGAFAFVRVTIDGKRDVLRVGSKTPMSLRAGSGFAGRTAGEEVGVPGVSPILRFTRNGRVELEHEAPIGTLRLDTSTAYPWNDSLVYKRLFDARDYQVYRTIKIGDLNWMAENMNYQRGGAWWRPDDSAAKGSVYGRFYTQAAFQYVADDSCLTGANCEFPPVPQGVCPAGWRVPTEADWQNLEKAVLAHPDVDSATIGSALSAKGSSESWPGIDLFGFRALPGGIRFGEDAWSGNGYWWTATKLPAASIFEWYARVLNPGASGTTFQRMDYNPSYALAARCVSP